MKKIALILALIMSLSLFAACGASASSSNSSSAASGSQTAAGLPEDLNEIMDKLYDGIGEDERPMMADAAMLNDVYPDTQKEGDKYRRVTEATAESDLGVTVDRFEEALVSESMMAMPYEVAVVRAKSAEEATQLANDIKENVDPRKWVCVEADKVTVETIDDVVLLVMVGTDFHELGDKVIANFKDLG